MMCACTNVNDNSMLILCTFYIYQREKEFILRNVYSKPTEYPPFVLFPNFVSPQQSCFIICHGPQSFFLQIYVHSIDIMWRAVLLGSFTNWRDAFFSPSIKIQMQIEIIEYSSQRIPG